MLHFYDSDRDPWTPTVASEPIADRDLVCGGALSQTDPPIFEEKITIPEFRDLFPRPRLLQLLKKTTSLYPATAIIGRIGTGKTVAAAQFSTAKENSRPTAWLTVGPTELNWGQFANYFEAAIFSAGSGRRHSPVAVKNRDVPMPNEIETFLITRFEKCQRRPGLIVLDDLHHIFDAAWFCDFLTILIASLPSDCRLLLLSRSKPPGPIWRMRSKQFLGVIDERRLLLSISEVAELCRQNRISETVLSDFSQNEMVRIATVAEILLGVN